MKIVSVVGARPQLVQLGPVHAALRAAPDVRHRVIHAGQHFDPDLSQEFFDELGIDPPDHHLGVGSGSHGVQTGAILARLDELLFSLRPDWTLVFGDTASTLASAVAAATMGLPCAHIDAGLRSPGVRSPEEVNRVLTDHACDLLLAPTARAAENLAREGLGDRTELVGDVMADVCLRTRADQVTGAVRLPPLPAGVTAGSPFTLAVIQRSENIDDADRLELLVAGLRTLGHPVVLVVTPRLRAAADRHRVRLDGGSLALTDPLPYPVMVRTLAEASGVVTDSGGIQKEAYLMGTPCTTLRAVTEWEETLADDWNVLAPSGADLAALALRPTPQADRPAHYGDGRAADHVLAALRTRRPR